MMEAHDRALSKAKVALMERTDSVFFTTVLFNLHHHWDSTIPTACTNGLELRVNPEFFMQQNREEQVGLLLHESLHVVFQHVTRRGERDPKKWNYAGDYVINDVLLERNFKLPEGALYDAQYHGLSTDEVYDLLPDPPQLPERPELMDIEEPGAGDPAALEEVQAQIDDILVQASIQSKLGGDAPGTIPGELQIYIDNLLAPKLPWYRILRKYLTNLVKDDYSFRRPNRRFFPKHYLPSQASEALCDIAWAVDASGSVSDAEFEQFIGEGAGIIRSLKPQRMTLLEFDTAIRVEATLRNLDDLRRVKFTGRGGTDVHPVMRWAQEHKPNVLIVFTDGHFTLPPNPKIPVIWVITDNPTWKAPYGQVIHYDTHKH